ncbi:hypothetical protein IJH19_02545, partial [Candidatus Saccharibacteria bacterium]|nr:hypothetical protein [Candidatus Saccharibacteria bacterium]
AAARVVAPPARGDGPGGRAPRKPLMVLLVLVIFRRLAGGGQRAKTPNGSSCAIVLIQAKTFGLP